MKATGIVRRIDDLGRVVIPKEIRRTMRIREGDPLEIYTNADGEVIFKKYSPINELSESAGSVAEVIYKLGGAPVVIFDRDHVVAVAGVPKREYLERRLSPTLDDILESRRSWTYIPETGKLSPVEGVTRHALAVTPIVTSGDLAGAVCFLANDDTAKGTTLLTTLTQTAAMFLSRQLE